MIILQLLVQFDYYFITYIIHALKIAFIHIQHIHIIYLLVQIEIISNDSYTLSSSKNYSKS